MILKTIYQGFYLKNETGISKHHQQTIPASLVEKFQVLGDSIELKFENSS